MKSMFDRLLRICFFRCGGSSSSLALSSREMMPTGMLMKKIHRQSKLSVIHPPSVGPMAGATTTAMP